MAAIIRRKEDYSRSSAEDMNRYLDAAQWSAPQKLALACRILAAEDHGSALAGQLTTRGDDPGAYWTMRFGLGLDEISADNLLLVDDDLRVLEGDGMPNPSNRFHLWIYRQKPAVNSIIHTHPPHTSALSMIGEPLAVAHMDTAVFWDDCAYLPEWPGVPIGDEEGRIISGVLGDKRAALLAHHGLVTACGTIEEAAMLALFLERAAKLQLLARAAGEIKPIGRAEAQEAHDYRLRASIIGATFCYFARKALKEDGAII
jgi:L-fuculose-phosphate aldolase